MLWERLELSTLTGRGPKPRAYTNSATTAISALHKAYYNLVYSISVAPIAQLVEQIPLKDKVPGPSPGGRTNKQSENDTS